MIYIASEAMAQPWPYVSNPVFLEWYIVLFSRPDVMVSPLSVTVCKSVVRYHVALNFIKISVGLKLLFLL